MKKPDWFLEFPGGKIEPGETPKEVLVRELKEEMDIDIIIDNYFGENIYSYDTITIKLIAFQGIIVKGNLRCTDTIAETGSSCLLYLNSCQMLIWVIRQF